jgi:hypothetical protein
MLLAACGGGENSSESPDTEESQLVSENGNDKTAFEFFVGKGLSKVQAAGIVGNLDQESGMSPTISQYGGGPGRGIAQWSAGGRWDSSYHDNVEWYASSHGGNKYSLTTQLDFIWYELTTIGYGFGALKASTDVSGATVVFETDFEICGTCDTSGRVADADSALASYGGTLPQPPAAPGGCGVIDAGQGLLRGQHFSSCGGVYTLELLADGDLVLYHDPGHVIWSSGTNACGGGYKAVLQGDGNFVVYDEHGHAVWASGTSGHPGDHLTVQEDGNLVIYAATGGALWASGTNGK